MSSQLVSRPHLGQCRVSPLTQSGAPIVFGGIPNRRSIVRTSWSLVIHFSLPGNECGESYTCLNISALTTRVEALEFLADLLLAGMSASLLSFRG